MPKTGPRLACAALAVALGACGSEPRCETREECAVGEGCVDGRCVSEADAGPSCGDACECTADGECAVAASCVEGSCVEGECFYRVDDDACGAGERCDMTAGCVAGDAGTTDDAGVDPSDAGIRDAGESGLSDASVADASVADAGATSSDAGPPDAGPAGCDIVSSDPNFRPAGYTEHIVPWTDAFYGNTFPVIDSGGLAPVGSFTFRTSSMPSGPPMVGRYISIPFVPEAGSNHRLDWNHSQAVLSRDYRVSYGAEAVYATISPCPGDFRLEDATVPRTDTLSRSCRELAKDGQMYYGTGGAGTQCVLEAGRTYYLNIVFADPFGGLDPTETTCEDESGRCNANFGM